MKNYISLLLTIVVGSVLVAQSAVETAIEQTIKDETHYFNQRDFEKLSDLWIHSPNAIVSISGPNMNHELRGWDEVSGWMKDFFTTNSNPAPDNQERSNFQFTIDGNVAFVTFNENGNNATRILQKNDGKWKILQVGQVQTKVYERQARSTKIKQLIESVQGKWQFDQGSSEARSGSGKITKFDLEIIPERTGMLMEGYLDVIFGEGNPQKEWNQIRVHFPNDPKTALVTYNWSFVDSPATTISSGKFEVTDGNKLVGRLTGVNGENPYVELTIHFKSNDRFLIDWSLLNPQGEENWGLTCELVKQGE